jgi:hypothetical protein
MDAFTVVCDPRLIDKPLIIQAVRNIFYLRDSFATNCDFNYTRNKKLHRLTTDLGD